MSKKEVIEERLYSSQDFLGRLLSVWRNKKVMPFIRGKLVDIGCGDNRLVSGYGSGTGVDIIDYGSADIVVKDFSKLPFEEKSVDTITIIASLNYFEQPAQVLKEVRCIMKDDGQLILTMSNHSVMRIWHKFRESWANKPGNSYHELLELLEKANLRILKKKSFMFFLNTIYIAGKKDE